MSGGSNDLIQRITNMQKRKLCIFVSGLLLMTSGLAMATPVVVDFDAALVSANQDPATCDGNGNGNGDPNGILDSDELAVLSWRVGPPRDRALIAYAPRPFQKKFYPLPPAEPA